VSAKPPFGPGAGGGALCSMVFDMSDVFDGARRTLIEQKSIDVAAV
jgi:hypothetical protein